MEPTTSASGQDALVSVERPNQLPPQSSSGSTTVRAEPRAW